MVWFVFPIHPKMKRTSIAARRTAGVVNGRHRFFQALGSISMTFTRLALCCSLSLATSFVTGCASPHVAYIIPGSPSPTHTTELSCFTMAATPASVQTPPASYIGGIGVGYDNYVSLPVTLTSVNGFSGQVSLSVAGLPEGVVTSSALFSQPIPPVALDFGNSPAVEVVSIGIYVMPGVAPGTYSFSITGFPLAGSNNAAPVILPATLTVTSGGGGAWQK
jgi:hypothetical protein